MSLALESTVIRGHLTEGLNLAMSSKLHLLATINDSLKKRARMTFVDQMEFACAEDGCDHSVADKDLQHRNEAPSAGYCADISPNSTSHEYMNIQCGTRFYFPKLFIAEHPKYKPRWY